MRHHLLKLGYKEVATRRFWMVMLCELLSTMLLVTFNGVVVSRHGSDSVIFTISAVSGFMYTVLLFIFGNHGYMNPAISISLFCFRKIPLIRTISYLSSQIVAATLANLLVGHVLVSNWYTSYGPAAMLITRELSLVKILLLEVGSMMLVSLAIGTHKPDYVIGLTLAMCNALLFPYTMGGLNPAQAISSHLVALKFTSYHWIYWVGPIAGAILGRLVATCMDCCQAEVPRSGLDNRPLLSSTESEEE